MIGSVVGRLVFLLLVTMAIRDLGIGVRSVGFCFYIFGDFWLYSIVLICFLKRVRRIYKFFCGIGEGL